MTATALTPSSNAATLNDRVNDLVGYIRSGRILEAMREFYADDVEMQDILNRASSQHV